MVTRIYADGADLPTMYELSKNPRVHGFTTNPSLCRKSGVKDYAEFCQAAEALGKPISFEVFSDDFREMERQAKIISGWGKEVYVKIPITNTKGECAIPLIERLVKQKIKVNVTAVFTGVQIKKCAKVLIGPPAILSIFAGRIADTGVDPRAFFVLAREIVRTNVQTLWASTRELYNLKQAKQCGADLITMSPELIAKLHFVNKDLAEFSRETVKGFYDDAVASGFTL